MNSAMWSVASTISVRYRLSCRIQEPRLFEHGRPNQRFQSVLRYQIHFPPEEMREIQHQASVVHQIDVGIRQKGNKHVAVGAHVSAGGGPDKRKVTGAVPSAEICQVGLIDLRVTELERAAHVLFPLLCPNPWRVGWQIGYRSHHWEPVLARCIRAMRRPRELGGRMQICTCSVAPLLGRNLVPAPTKV